MKSPIEIINYVRDNIPLGVCCHLYNYRGPIVKDNSTCLYKHIKYLISYPAGRVDKLKEWSQHLRDIGFKENHRFAETAVVITDMNNPNGIRLCCEIFDMYMKAQTLRD